MTQAERLREIPSVDAVLSLLPEACAAFPRRLVVQEIRRVLEECREAILSGAGGESTGVETKVMAALGELVRPSLRRVINATGVILHTNLGRAPLPEFTPPRGYSNLEYDLATGKRGRRDAHLSGLLQSLLGQPAIVVNNNAAAVYLALNELAAGKEAVVSRGELIEIGDGFRIPDIMVRSGAILREVGTTNRTRIEDYRDAITPQTALLMRVHPSNFRMEGFTARPELQELVDLGRQAGIPVYEDLGSGCVTDLRAFGIREPLVADSLAAGVDLVSFSGDKLLGAAQAGFLTGRADLVSRLRGNPMFRALRLDKLIYQVLEVTVRSLLLERWDNVPALRMIRQSEHEIRSRAEALLRQVEGLETELRHGESLIGGGATPEQPLPTWLISIGGDSTVKMEKRLRAWDPPVITRIEEDRLALDLRTVFPEDEPELIAALQALSR